jgi:hypothetical protein
MEQYILNMIASGGVVFLGVYTQPYSRVEENSDVVLMYNNIIQQCQPRLHRKTTNLQVKDPCDLANPVTVFPSCRLWYSYSNRSNPSMGTKW